MNGSIRRRSDSSWELTVDLGRDASGKRRRKFVNVKGTKAEAQKKLDEARDKRIKDEITEKQFFEIQERYGPIASKAVAA